MKHFDAEKLKAFRTENHFSQSEIASQLYVSRTVISNWENGKSQPDSAQLNQLESGSSNIHVGKIRYESI